MSHENAPCRNSTGAFYRKVLSGSGARLNGATGAAGCKCGSTTAGARRGLKARPKRTVLARRGNLARAVGEHKRIVHHIADDRVAGSPLARQELLGERILNEALDGTAERARAVGEVGALGDDLGDGRIGETDVRSRTRDGTGA